MVHRAALVVALIALVVVGLASATGKSDPSAVETLLALKRAGLPIGKYRVYNAATDPNKLLGRPGHYTSKVNFNDTRLVFRADYSVDAGGAVEAFASEQHARNRYNYLVALTQSPLFAAYNYLRGKSVLRLSSDLTPRQARQYEVVFRGGKLATAPVPTRPSARIIVVGRGATPGSVLDSYGAILKNTGRQDAEQVVLTGNLVDASGTIVSGVTPIVPVIPAGATYYWGGTVPHRKGTRATRFEVTVKSADLSGPGAKLPTISRVKIGSDGYNTIVSGRVRNGVGFALSQIATINVVFLSKHGKVLGGANGYLDSDLPPGRAALFEVNAFKIIPRSEIAAVKVTMDAQRIP